MESTLRRTIIIVDDDPLVNSSLKMALEKLGYIAIACANGKDYLQALENAEAELVLMDVHLGDTTGIALLEETRKRGNEIPVVMITGYGDVQIAVRSIKAGAEDFILKPITVEQLQVAVEKALRIKGLTQEVQRLRRQIQDDGQSKKILGTSRAIRDALSLAEKFAQSDDTTVLIQGDSGTGKELFAQYIHYHSARSGEPLIIVDCTAIPKDLAENELFGYERGAFTGATEKLKKGRFELAHNGTIFLDEIGDIPAALQAKLLRVIESKKFYRLGGTQEVSSDVRVIAATNRNLAEAVKKGTFREDLYYRLNVAHIVIPPLRERAEDMLVIADALFEEFNAKFRKHVRGITPEAADILRNYQWPGNVRELRNVIERVMLVSSDDMIVPEHLRFLSNAPTTSSGAIHSVATPSMSAPVDGNGYVLRVPPNGVSMGEVMRDLIMKTLEITNGNQLQAAKILGITRAKFRYRLEQLGIEQPKVKFE
ncbi:MAG TPA: sigma-54 dependent transcriptional regulator [Candidatus Kapabacteria bacterium]|nr:sigma-54 dependent transcriptional regulator [Candidatus Kapabacteria bacterium]